MFPAAPAAPFAINVTCRGVLVIYFSDFQDLLRFVTISVTSCGSDKPVCHRGAKVCLTMLRLSMICHDY